MSEWSKIKTVEQWGAKLRALLKEAKPVADNGDLKARKAMAERLTQYVEWSRPGTSEEIQEHDKIATNAAAAILLAEAGARFGAFMAQNAEYAALRKKLESEAQANKEAAADLRFERLTNAVISARDLAKSFNEVRKSLKDSGNEKKLGGDITKFLTEANTLRKRIANLAGSA